MAYLAAVVAHPAFTARFQPDLAQPGPARAAHRRRQPVRRGRRAGPRGDLAAHLRRALRRPEGRPPAGPPRLPKGARPDAFPKDGAIPGDPEPMPDEIDYDAADAAPARRQGLHRQRHRRPCGRYEVSGKQVLTQWFSYRKKNRERPIIGDRRPPSTLGDIQPDHWLAEYTSDLLNLLHVLGRLVALEPRQADLLERVCAGRLITVDDLRAAGVLAPAGTKSGPAEGESDDWNSCWASRG